MRTIYCIPSLSLLILLFTCSMPVLAQEPAAATPQSVENNRPKINFNDYINEVVRRNLDLAIQRSSIALSQTGVTSAKERPDWSVDLGFPSADLSNQGSPMTWSTGLSVPFEVGGKRKARVRAATADVATTQSAYEDALRQSRASAADAFIDSLGSREILQSKQKSLGEFDRIVQVNEERVRVGDIGEIELVQSRVNRDQFRADVITAQADVVSADLVLGQQLGQPQRLSSQLPVPIGRLEISGRTFNLDGLVASSFQNRADVISKTRALKAAELRIELAKTNLIPDVSFSGAYAHTGLGTGGFAQPPDNTLSFGLSANIPISRLRYQGEVEAARAARTQAELQLSAVQLRAETEVRTAYSRYQASVERLELYRSGMLKNADRVLEARLYAYQRGGATLLEVIDAERTSADVYLSYSQALVEHAHALVALEQTSGIWDISF
ncbi:MAG TPA: TolC family protein [Candidatus Acidoferrum sp.]|nr:TolC family protein [Candidatus Acidoferrum sp.]